jgi:hypothetical protein
LAQPKRRAGLGTDLLLVQKIGLRAHHGRLQPRGFESGSIELGLDADNGGVGHRASGQRTEQFALSGASGVYVAPSGVRRCLCLLFRPAEETGLHDQILQRPLLAGAAQISKALQGNIRSHRMISRICRCVSAIVALVALA